ncbi:MAG: polymer-forming cytoskeletal protein [Nocardiopsis sp. BM-2018]|nr:MAG: polymer-forming cytoskeletal protein [Nocardiopsis sp. BM-2018]
MFRRRQRERTPASDAGSGASPPERFTYVHHGTTLTGRLAATGRVRVHGAVHGDVAIDGLLEVAKDGVVEGTSIEASALVVLGRVRGDVRVSGTVEVWKGGVLEGDVQAGSLDIEEGATFVGRSQMPLPGGPPQLDAPAERVDDAVAPADHAVAAGAEADASREGSG